MAIKAQDSTNTGQNEELSLEELMNIPVTVASSKATTLRESPGIVTVITSDDIHKMGARDLIDVLKFVPGFEFAQDVQNYVSLGIRGNWASEGKVAVIVDGIVMNDLLYATVPFGGHFSVDQISKIEIIRGPGSAIYGGAAELAVINITTKQSEENALNASVMYGQMQNGMGRINANLGLGKEYKSGLKLWAKGYYGNTSRGDGTYTDFYYDSVQFDVMKEHKIENFYGDAGLRYKGLTVNFLIDYYSNKHRNGSGTTLSQTVSTAYNTIAASAKYDFKIGDKIKLTPIYQYMNQLPWSGADSIYGWYMRRVQRHTARLEFNYDPIDILNINAGIQYFHDYGKSEDAPDSISYYQYNFAPNNEKTIYYNNFSAYLQLLLNTKIINITAGARFDQHSLGFNAFVPRIALTKSFNKFHFKVLASQAFRSPYIQNMSSTNIKPELATVFEAEIGKQFGNKFNVIFNAFYTTIKDALIYVYATDSNGIVTQDGYFNGAQTGTWGGELQLKFKDKWGSIDLNYAYYNNSGINQVSQFAVNPSDFKDPNDKSINWNTNQAFAPHKINLMMNFNITKNLNWSLNGNFLSDRYAWNFIQKGDATNYMTKFDATFLINTFIQYDNLFTKGLSVGAGCYNILGQANPYLMPYTSSVSPMAGPSREFVFRLKYNFGL